jgi:hypothetical protein
VVQVDLDFAEPAPAESGEGVEMFGVVGLDGVEEGMTRRQAVGVAKAAERPGYSRTQYATRSRAVAGETPLPSGSK